MALEPGTRLGSYEIVSVLGAGGMGQVYKALDTRLDRHVAIKVLTPNVANDDDRLARFEREAKSISALTHPGICALYDIGTDADTPFLVMELVEGETLAARIGRGPLPVDQAIGIAIDIANALDHAHRRGIVHRDLKPANVMLSKGAGSPSPHAKLLDFGLAKFTAPAARPRAEMETALAAGLTARGTILGTLQYMSPEQVEGSETDARADVWAFGCLLYEMASGKRPFDGKSPAAIISAILSSEPPPLAQVQPAAPAALDLVIRECLAKDPDRRFQSIHDALAPLQWIASGSLTSSGGAAAPAATRSSTRALLAASAVFLAGAALASLVWSTVMRPSAVATPAARLSIPFVNRSGFQLLLRNDIAISPDGRQIVYEAFDGAQTHLFRRLIDRFEATMLPGTEGADGPFFSPDSQQLAFWASSQLKRMPIDGGAATVVCDASDMRGGTWVTADTIVLAPTLNDGLYRVRATGGTPERLTTLDASARERTHRFPSALPNGKGVVFMAASTDIASMAEGQIFAQPLDGGARTLLVQGGMSPQVAAGRLFYYRGDALVAAPFDEDRLAVTGKPVVIATDVAWAANFATTHYGVAADGTLAYLAGGEVQPRRKIALVDRTGVGAELGAEPRFYNAVRISPDGKRILLWDQGANDRLSVYDIARQTLSRITDRGNVIGSAWTADGTAAITVIGKDLVRVKSDGSGVVELLTTDAAPKTQPDTSPDGDTVAYAVATPGAGWDIWLRSLKTGKAAPWAATRFNELEPRFSHDGQWIAYESDETGTNEVFIRALDGHGGRIQVTSGGGSVPVWSADGRELFFRRLADLYAVDVQTAAGLVGIPHKLFTVAGALGSPGFDVMPDGRHFLVLESQPTPIPVQINVMLGTLAVGGR